LLSYLFSRKQNYTFTRRFFSGSRRAMETESCEDGDSQRSREILNDDNDNDNLS